MLNIIKYLLKLNLRLILKIVYILLIVVFLTFLLGDLILVCQAFSNFMQRIAGKNPKGVLEGVSVVSTILYIFISIALPIAAHYVRKFHDKLDPDHPLVTRRHSSENVYVYVPYDDDDDYYDRKRRNRNNAVKEQYVRDLPDMPVLPESFEIEYEGNKFYVVYGEAFVLGENGNLHKASEGEVPGIVPFMRDEQQYALFNGTLYYQTQSGSWEKVIYK